MRQIPQLRIGVPRLLLQNRGCCTERKNAVPLQRKTNRDYTNRHNKFTLTCEIHHEQNTIQRNKYTLAC